MFKDKIVTDQLLPQKQTILQIRWLILIMLSLELGRNNIETCNNFKSKKNEISLLLFQN